MERERLNRLVEAPEALGKEDLADVQALAERYPWFAGAQVLNSIGQHLAGEVLSDETLTTAAAHVPSRAVLFDLMGTPRPLAPMSVVPAGPTVEIDTAAPVNEEPTPVEISDPDPTPATVAPTFVAPVPEPTETDPLERQFLEAALASSYDLSWMQPPPADPVPALPAELPPPQVIEPLPDQVIGMTEEEAPPLPEPEVRPAPRPSRMRFTDWLVEEPANIGPAHTTPSEALPAVERLEPLAPRQTIQPVIPAAEVVDTRDLIARFISQQNPQPPAKAEFYTPQQAAKRSLDDSTGMVTETLARIYAKQGDLPKAIDAYRRLALKYPEKSAYFAALAKELEGQQHK